MSEYRTIKELVVETCISEGSFPSYEKLTSQVLQHFPNSRWQKTHYAWYKSKIKTGDISVPGRSFALAPMTNRQDHSLPPDENAVVVAICHELTTSGFEIKQKLHTTERGIDVIAWNPQTKVKVLVEAKGGTSSRQDSERYGKPYTQTQVFDRVAKGIFTCLQLRTENPDKDSVRVVLAIPEEPHHFKKYISTVSSSLDSAGIEVWFAKARSN